MRRLLVVLVLAACRPTTPNVADVTLPPLPPLAPATSQPGVRYALPSCPLTYDVLIKEKHVPHNRSDEEEDDEEEDVDFDTERYLNLTATRVNQRMEIGGEVTGRSIRNGVRSWAEPSRDYAPVILETDGLGWTEREGPTLLYSDIGAHGGLAWFFPALPATADSGATALWDVPHTSGLSVTTTRVEAARGNKEKWGWLLEQAEKGGWAKEIPTTYTKAQLRVDGATTESGVRVVHYAMTGAFRAESDPADTQHRFFTKTYQGSYAVTSAGRVVRAHVESKQVGGTDDVHGKPFNELTIIADATMHLVRRTGGALSRAGPHRRGEGAALGPSDSHRGRATEAQEAQEAQEATKTAALTRAVANRG